MDQQNQGNNSNYRSVVTIAATVLLGYGAYKYFESIQKERQKQIIYEKNKENAFQIVMIVVMIAIVVVVGYVVRKCVSWIWAPFHKQ